MLWKRLLLRAGILIVAPMIGLFPMSAVGQSSAQTPPTHGAKIPYIDLRDEGIGAASAAARSASGKDSLVVVVLRTTDDDLVSFTKSVLQTEINETGRRVGLIIGSGPQGLVQFYAPGNIIGEEEISGARISRRYQADLLDIVQGLEKKYLSVSEGN